MLKRKIDDFIAQHFQSSRNALLITGARQIGKTTSIRAFGKTFESFIEINFIENPKATELFQSALSPKDIFLRLSLLTDRPLIKGKTLIFFDEVQMCPEIVTAIKFLVEEGSYQYVMSGSLLGVELKDLRSEPVGFLSVKDMYPMDFEEFILNCGVNHQIVETLREAWLKRESVDNFIHQKMMELFRLYLIVGGMPSAVKMYLANNNLQDVLKVQQDILRLYRRDISQYDPKNKLAIDEIFSLIAPELNAKNKRFILKRLQDAAKFSRFENSFLWLKNAGVALPVYQVSEPKAPLLLNRTSRFFKLFQSDVGLLAAQYANGIQTKILLADKSINYGAIFENVVAQELVAHGLDPYFYNSKKRGELDFVLMLGDQVLPIEVKSGKDYTSHRALNNLLACEDYNLPEAIVFNSENLQVSGKIVYTPIYMVMFLEMPKEAMSIYKVDLRGLQ